PQPAANAPSAAIPSPTATTPPAGADAQPAPPIGSRSAEPPKNNNENSAIYMLLGRYQSAFNDLNVSVAKSVSPSVNERGLARAFEGLERQEVVFDSCQIDAAASRAVVTCRGRTEYVPKVGSRTARLEPRRWVFKLTNAGAGWLIDSVVTR